MIDRPERFMYLSWLEKAKTDPFAQQMVERFRKRPEFQLYDLAADPSELNNLAGKAEFASTKARLWEAIKQWMLAQGDSGAAMDVKPRKRRG